MIEAPPLLDGAAHLSVTCLSPGVTAGFRGAPGTVRGVADTDAALPLPTLLTARTLNAYDVPFVSPVNV